LGEPRTTVGYNFLTPLAILNKLELYLCGDGDIEEAVDNLLLLNQKLIPDVPICNNPAKELAINIEGKIVIVYGAGILSGVARRWKAQLNENAKAWAFMEILPEADHNAVSGINWPKKIRKNIAVVMLQSIDLHYRIKLRYKYTSDIFAKFGISQFRIDGVGQGKPAQILSSVMFGDYTSYYLAILNRENPSRVDSIEYIKNNMGNMF
jgi:glucose/mannose-6-phosphate isomerase